MSRASVFSLGAMRGVAVLFLLVAVTVFAAGQDLVLNGTVNNDGTINVNRHVVNNTNGAVSVTSTGLTGRVQLTGAANAVGHSIYGNTAASTISFFRLDMRGARETRLEVDIAVTDRLRVGYASNTFTAGDSGFTIKGKTLAVGNTSTYDASSSAALTFAGGTVNYTNATSQIILDKTATYGTLGLTGNAAYTVPAGAAIDATTVNHTGIGTVTVNESVTVTGSGTLGTIANIATGKVVDFQGTVTASTIAALTATTGTGTLRKSGTADLTLTGAVGSNAGTIENTGTAGTLAIGSLTANGGTIQTTNAGNITFSGAAASNGIIQATAPSTGTITFANNLSGTGALTLAGSSVVQFAGSVAQTSYSYAAGSTQRFNGATDQSVPGAIYRTLDLVNSNIKSLQASTDIRTALTASSGNPNVTIAGATTLNTGATADIKGNLTLNAALTTTGAGTVTLSGGAQSIGGTETSVAFNALTLGGSAAKSSSLDITVNGAFTPTFGIDMATADKTLYAKGSVGSYGDLQEVTGKMKRDISGTGVAVKMNNELTQITFAVAAPADFTLDVRPNSTPTGGNLVFDVNRKATMSYPAWGATGSATLQMAYRYGERPTGGGNEAKTRFYDVTAAGKIATGVAATRQASNATDLTNAHLGYVTLAGINPTGSASTIARSKVATGSEIKATGATFPFVTINDGQSFAVGGTWDEGSVPTSTDDAQISHTGITVPAVASVATLTIDASKDITVGGADLTATTINDAGTVVVSATRTLTATTYNKTGGTGTFTGKAAFTSLNMTAGSLAFNGTAGDASTIQNAVTLDNGSSISVGGTLSAVTASASDFTLNGSASLSLPNASSVLNIGTSSFASNLKLNGTSSLTVSADAGDTGNVNVFGNLEIGALATLTNSGTINVGN